jgi:hypothetical protein
MGLFSEIKNEVGKFKPKVKPESMGKSLKSELSKWRR